MCPLRSGWTTCGKDCELPKLDALRVTDSAHVTVSKVVSVTVSVAPTAAITIEGNPTGSVQVGVPVTFTLTASLPVGAAITSWTVYGEWLDGGYGTPLSQR